MRIIFIALVFAAPALTLPRQAVGAGSEVCDADARSPESDKYCIPPDNESSEDVSTSDASSDAPPKISEPRSPGDFVKAFGHLGTSVGSVLEMYRETFRDAEGTEHRRDVYAKGDDMDGALDLLRDMVLQAVATEANAPETEEESSSKWAFVTDLTLPLYEEFGRTLDDVLLSFLRWASVNGNEDSERQRGGVNHSRPKRINVSKAFKRFQSYASWMESNGEEMFSPPLTTVSVKDEWEEFQMRLSHDEVGRLVWWLDLGKINGDKLRSIPENDTLRLFVWLAHLLMFDEGAQLNGMVIVDSMNKIGFFDFMTMMPMELGMQIDRLAISVLPIKTKRVLFMKSPLWFDVGLGVLKLFLSSRMRRRIKLVNYDQSAVEETVGADFIPVGFDDFEGKLPLDDLVTERYFNEEKNGTGKGKYLNGGKNGTGRIDGPIDITSHSHRADAAWSLSDVEEVLN